MNTNAEHEAAKIIEGFLDRFEAPTCIEQQEVVSQAFAWLSNYYSENSDVDAIIKAHAKQHTFAAQAISQQNQNDNQNHTD